MHANPTPISLAALPRAGTVALGLSGGLLVLIGASILTAPLAYQAGMGVTLPAEPTLLSDLRAMGGGLLALGLLLIAGARSAALRTAAAVAGATLYLSYGLSRLLSMGVDGLPDDTLIVSAGIELVVGGALALVASRALRR